MLAINNTTYKLQEADFFLNKLEPHRPYFDFYLSAFLNASRSITWIMRNEFNKNPDWIKWFENTSIADKEKKLLAEINKLRIQSTKQSGIQTEYFILDHIIPDLDSYDEIERMLTDLTDSEVEITISESSEEKNEKESGKYIFTGKVKMEKDDSIKSREELFEICQEYYVFLKKKVEDCTKKFT